MLFDTLIAELGDSLESKVLSDLAEEIRAKEASFGELSLEEVRSALSEGHRAKLKEESGEECGEECYCYGYVRAVFGSFLVAFEEYKEDGKYKNGYFKRPYSVSGTAVEIGDRGIRVELSWVPALTELDASGMEAVSEVKPEQEMAALLESIKRGEPSQESVASDAEVMKAVEAEGTMKEATFVTGVLEGIIPIVPGMSINRKFYSKDTLKRDIAVFNGQPVFYDHQDENQPKPLKNVIGVLENARWDDTAGAPRCDMRYPHSMEGVIDEIKGKFNLLGKERVGFSIDMPIKARVGQVKGTTCYIVEALLGGGSASTDIVFRPAAGGSFDKAFESAANEETGMTAEELALLQAMKPEDVRSARPELFSQEAVTPAAEASAVAAPAQAAAPAPAAVAVQATEAVTEDTISKAVSKALDQRDAENAFKAKLEKSGISGRMLVAAVREAQDTGWETKAVESILGDWIDQAGEKAGTQVSIPGGSLRVNENADVRYARLLGAALGSDQEVNGQTVRRFTSFRESILAFHPEAGNMIINSPNRFARECMDYLHWGGGELSEMLETKSREAVVSTTYALAWADVMNKVMLKEIADPKLNNWRDIVSDFVSFSDLTNTKKFVTVGDYSDIEQVEEGEPYQMKADPTEEKVEFGIDKYGNLAGFTWEAALRDDLGVLAKIPKKLARAWAWTVYRFIWALLTANAGDGATVDTDSKVIYHADHVNSLNTAFTIADLITLEGYMGDQTDISEDNPKLYQPKYLCYSHNSALRAAIWEALNSAFKVNPLTTSGSQVNLPNYIKEYMGLIPKEVYYAGTSTRWEVIADPAEVPTIAVGFLNGRETPELFVQDMERVGSMFNNDKVTYKIRGTVGADVLQWRSFARGRK